MGLQLPWAFLQAQLKSRPGYKNECRGWIYIFQLANAFCEQEEEETLIVLKKDDGN